MKPKKAKFDKGVQVYDDLLKQKYKMSYFFSVGPWLKWTKIMWSPSHSTAISSRKKSR